MGRKASPRFSRGKRGKTTALVVMAYPAPIQTGLMSFSLGMKAHQTQSGDLGWNNQMIEEVDEGEIPILPGQMPWKPTR